jgi:hypothetical protein
MAAGNFRNFAEEGARQMRNLLAFLALVVLVVGGIGLYQGWFKIQSVPAAEGHQHINLDVDKKKIADDLHRTEQRFQKAIENNAKDDSGKGTGNAPPDAPKKDSEQ